MLYIIYRLYVHDNRASKCVKWKLIELNREIEKFTVTAGDFKTSLSVIGSIVDRKSGYRTKGWQTLTCGPNLSYLSIFIFPVT